MQQVPLWTFLGSIPQIMSRLNFEHTCFLDQLVLRLATEYPSIVIYPFQVSYECFEEAHPHVKHQRPLIQQIAAAVTNPFLQRFVDSLKVLNLPEKVLQYHLNEFTKSDTKTKSLKCKQLKAGYDDVFNNPLRGDLSLQLKAKQKDFDELLKRLGMHCIVLYISLIANTDPQHN